VLTDPFPAYNFLVGLIDTSTTLRTVVSAVSTFVLGGFTECSGLEGTLLLEEHQAGGENGFVYRFPTRMTWSNLTLRKGVTFAEDLWNWHHDYVLGKGKRRDGFIVLQAEAGLLPGMPIAGGPTRAPVKVWRFKGGIPVKWTGPTFNAAQSAVAVEALEIAHQGLELYSPGTGIAAGARALGI
jgi:phage tail-like protein